MCVMLLVSLQTAGGEGQPPTAPFPNSRLPGVAATPPYTADPTWSSSRLQVEVGFRGARRDQAFIMERRLQRCAAAAHRSSTHVLSPPRSRAAPAQATSARAQATDRAHMLSAGLHNLCTELPGEDQSLLQW